MKRLLSEELVEARTRERYGHEIEGGFQVMAENEEFRRVAARTYIKFAGMLSLTESQAAHFLSIEENVYQGWLKETWDKVTPDDLEKISLLMGIDKYLMRLYSGQKDRVTQWFEKENKGGLYGGHTPFQLLDGATTPVFYAVRRDLAAATV